MKPENTEPLRGDAAWRFAKDQVAKRNDAARVRIAGEREAHEVRQAEHRRVVGRLERADTPKQPRP